MRPIDAKPVEKIFKRWLDDIPDGEETPAIEQCLNVVKNAPTLTPPNEWISVKERLPEDNLPKESTGHTDPRRGSGTDIDGLIERLKTKDFERDYDCTPFECGVFGLLDAASTALSTLYAENQALRNAVNEFKDESKTLLALLEQMKRRGEE